jgi:chromosome segregation ATPase
VERLKAGRSRAQVTNRPQATCQSVLLDASGAGSLNVTDHSFGVEQPNEPNSKGSDDRSASVPVSDRPEKIVVVCPKCQATLRVRRVYIGNSVRCKSCDQIFTVAVPPPDPLRRPAEDVPGTIAESPSQQPETEREIRRLKEEIDRVRLERNDLCDERDRARTELSEIRASLGGLAPAEFRNLAEERDTLRAQVLRLGYEIRDLRADQSAHALRAAELEGRVGELNTARRELTQLGGKLQERDVELESARTLHADLNREHQSAIEQVKTLQATIDERDQAIQRQADQHRAELESHVQALDHTRQQNRDALESLEAELVSMREHHGRLLEVSHSSEDLRTQLQARILELEETQEKIKSEYQSTIEAESTKQRDERDRLTSELNELRASLGEVAPTQVRPLAEERDSLRAEVLRLGDEIRAFNDLKSAHALLSTELKGRVGELDAARRELAVVTDKVKERDVELDSTRALHAGLTRDHESAIDEIKALQTTLDERDQAIRHQADQHHAELERHIEALEHARQQDREAIERLEAELVALGDRHRCVGEDLHARDELCTRFQNRIVELEQAREEIKSEYESAIEAGRAKEKELTEQLREQRAKSDTTGRPAEELVSTSSIPDDVRIAMSDTLQTVLTQVEDLKQWLTESERLNRDMAALLETVGIKYAPPVRR